MMSPTARRVVWKYFLVRKAEKENLGISTGVEGDGSPLPGGWRIKAREKTRIVKETRAIINRERRTMREKGDSFFFFIPYQLYNCGSKISSKGPKYIKLGEFEVK